MTNPSVDSSVDPETVRERAVTTLVTARDRTTLLTSCVEDPDLTAQHSPLMSPLVWDLAHIGWFEELWLVRRLADDEPLDERFDDLYDAFRHSRGGRATLPILTPAEAVAYLESVRGRALEVLESVTFDDHDPLLRNAYVYGLVLQHELQHQETMLQTLQLSGVAYPTPRTTTSSHRLSARTYSFRPARSCSEPTSSLGPTTTSGLHMSSSCPHSRTSATLSRTSASRSSSRTAAIGSGATGATTAGGG
jgi:hypothetical protein